MHRPNRRELLKTTGVGAGVALGMGGASAQQGTVNQTVTTDQVRTTAREATKVFTATADSGYINIDSANNKESERIPLSGGVDGDIIIEGVVYSDNTWESTRIQFPNLDPQTLLENFAGSLPIDPSNIDADITIDVDPISGTYNASQGKLTADNLSLSINVVVRSPISAEISVSASAALTTGQSGDMNGSVNGGLDGGTATATLVGNEFKLPKTGETISIPLVGDINIDDRLGLPSPAGRNYLQLTLSLDITNVDDGQTGPVPVSGFTGTGTNGFIALGTSNRQNKRVDFGSENGSEYSIDGQIYSDGTWESTNVSIPSVGLDKLIKNQATFNIDLGITSFDISVANVNTTINVEKITGEYKPQQGLVTGNLDVEISVLVDLVEVAGITAGSLEFTVSPDTAPLTTKTSNGPNTSEGITGSASGLASSSPQVSLVSQEFNVPGVSGKDTSIAGIDVTGTINNVLNLPGFAGENWVRLDLDLDLDSPQAVEDALVFDPVVSDPPKDLDGDDLFEDVDGDGIFDNRDVRQLFDNLDSPAVQNQTDIFTFAGGLKRSSAGVVDVQALYEYLENENYSPPDVIVPVGEIDLVLQGGPDEADVGETVTYDIVVEGATQGVGAFDFSVMVRDSTVAKITDFDYNKQLDKGRSTIAEDGSRVDLRVATLGNPYSGGDSIRLGTVTVQAENPGAASSVRFDMGSFPQGVFGPAAQQYEVANSSERTLRADYLAQTAIETQKSPGGASVTVAQADMGNEGGYVGIWKADDGTPTQLLGSKQISASGVVEDIKIDLSQTMTTNQEIVAAVHPPDDSGPNTNLILASDAATVEISPPSIDGLNRPKDHDGDGLYEAVRGNAQSGLTDVQTLFDNLDAPEVQNYSRQYNFSGVNEAEVTILDVQALFNDVT